MELEPAKGDKKMEPQREQSKLDAAFKAVGELVKIFKANESSYLSADYQEAEARKDFIDKFFIALGWDVNHDDQTNPYEQEVKVEKNASSQRRADYAFYLAPNFHDVRFFVEAKKPHGDIATDKNYFQTIRYGWNSDTPLAVLTDFEQFHVLDCRYKPNIDTALNRCYKQFHYHDYADSKKFAEIYWLFSREAVADNSLEKRAKELPKPRGKAVQRGLFPGGWQSIDESFLQELDEYRKELAKAFKQHNRRLDSETLTELAQRTLDRLVFIRFLEDKGIEPDRLVEDFGDKGTAWEEFIAASRRLDGIYNGVVFKQHFILDAPNFRVDENIFGDICEKLAHVNSPYDFNNIPIHILGAIYERFLGKVIVASNKRVRVEEKPEVRKAGGIYYTPEYIVRYIVENTVGKLIEGKTPEQIAEMRFADIACGSGSFLLGIFDLLLNYHGNYYNQNRDKARKGDCIERDGKLYLSLSKKREILLNNIYGVDIDTQAVQVCQLSLDLKLLEAETATSTDRYLWESERVAKMKKLLPDLSKNIVCGNSLIGTDILEGRFDFDTKEERKLNPMNFEDAFPEVMNKGGFDAVIGNPPWGADVVPSKAYFDKHFENRTPDSAAYFFEIADRLAKYCFGFIVPKTIAYYTAWESIRKCLLQKAVLRKVLDAGLAFPSVNLESVVLIFDRTGEANTEIDCAEPLKHPTIPKIIRPLGQFPRSVISIANVIPFIALENKEAELLLKLNRQSVKGAEVAASIFRGIYISDAEKTKLKSGPLKFINKVPDVKRYYIERHKKISLGKRDAWTRKAEKIMTPRIFLKVLRGSRLVAYPDVRGEYLTTEKLVNLVIDASKYPVSYNFLCGIINSKVPSFYIQRVLFSNTTETSRVMDGVYLNHLIFPTLNFDQPADKTRHDEIAAKVEAMLDAKKQLAAAQTDKDKQYYEQKCSGLDHQIDRLVYELYGLTEAEIKIVEGEL